MLGLGAAPFSSSATQAADLEVTVSGSLPIQHPEYPPFHIVILSGSLFLTAMYDSIKHRDELHCIVITLNILQAYQ